MDEYGVCCACGPLLLFSVVLVAASVSGSVQSMTGISSSNFDF